MENIDGTICKKHKYAVEIEVRCMTCGEVGVVPNVDFVEKRIEICEHKQENLVHICNKR